MKHREEIKKELLLADEFNLKNPKIQKDILIVVHDQYDYILKCINSIFKNTRNFNLHVWNNGSGKKTTEYLNKISKQKNIKLYTSKKNIGFIEPNNEMVKHAKSPYFILLNSDTEVLPMWDCVLMSWLDKHQKYAQSGYIGGYLNKYGRGVRFGHGDNVDYISGFCFCIKKQTYEKFGLFDKNLQFAYCEDSDFSLRLRDKKQKIYACYSKLVIHHENKTIRQVVKQVDVGKFIRNNEKFIRSKWFKYLPKS
jgi:GT2 family glycosyltransferase